MYVCVLVDWYIAFIQTHTQTRTHTHIHMCVSISYTQIYTLSYKTFTVYGYGLIEAVLRC